MESPQDQTRIQSYRDLVVWQKAMQLAEATYRATSKFSQEEIYGLSSQMRRAAVSIASNIAEGHDRHSRGKYLQFLGHARGSLAELETQTILSGRLGYLSRELEQSIIEQMAEVGRVLNGLRNSLRVSESS
jgi:four helix bundle protein